MESAPSRSGDSDAEELSAQLFDFLQLFERDLERGAVRELAAYQRRFPAIAEQLEREYATRLESRDGRASAMQIEIGPYRLERELGRGGQGVVYLAEDTRIQRRVALKLLPAASLLVSAERRERLRREAEVVSRLDHPGICGIYDAEIGEEHAYIAMPVIEGYTLGAAIARVRDAQPGAEPHAAQLPVAPRTREELRELLAFFEDCARALHAAHEAGVVHRDIKSANLMVTPEGRGVWLDFGQASDAATLSQSLTLSGDVFGTPAYMSPEQIAGASSQVDARTDVWALGVTLFEALTLQRPFSGASVNALMNAVLDEPPLEARKLNPILSRDVEVVLNTALEKDLTRRYTSALELAEELARIRRIEPILARPAGPLLRLSRWAHRSPVIFAAISGALLTLSVALIWALQLLAREEVALDYALGRHLGERAVALLEEDPSASLVLGIESVERAPSYLTRSALFAALEHCYLAHELDGSPARRFRDIEIVPDGVHVAAALSDGSVRLFDLARGLERARWQAHAGDALHVVCAGDWIASSGKDGVVVVYDRVQQRIVASFPSESEAPIGLRVSEDGARLVVYASMTSLKQYRLPAGEPVPGGSFVSTPNLEAARLAAQLEPEAALVTSVLAPDETRLAVVDERGRVKIWDLATRREVASFEGYLKPIELAWSLDSEFVVTNSKGPTARVWFATQRSDVYSLSCADAPLTHAEFSGDGERALTLTRGGVAQLWATPGAPRRASEVGLLLATTTVSEGALLPPEFEEFAESLQRHAHERAGASVTLTRSALDRSLRVTATPAGALELFGSDASAPRWKRKLLGEGARIVDLTFDPRGTELAIACSDRRVRFVSVSDGTPSREELRVISPRQVHWSPDGERLLVTGSDGRAAFHVEHLKTGARMRTEVFHHGDITGGCFSPDGALVLTGSLDGTIFVRDVRDGQPIVHLEAHGAPVLAAAFSGGDGPLRVIGACADGVARVWPVDPLPGARARKPRELAEWEHAREERLALPLRYR